MNGNGTKNRYTDTVEKLKLSDEALAKGIERMRNYDDDGKVVYMKTKFKGIKAAVAAMLVLAVGVGAVFARGFVKNDAQPLKDAFTLTANAQELTDSTQILIGEFQGSGAGLGTSDNTDNIIIRKYIEFPITCEGEGIESVTYSVENYNSEQVQLYFVINKSFEGLISLSGSDNEGDKSVYIPNTYVAGKYTVDFNNQPLPEQFGIRNADGSKSAPVILSIGFDERPDVLGDKSVEDALNDLNELSGEKISEFFSEVLSEFVSKHHDNMKVDVTANFTDGTSQKKTIQLSFDTADYGDDFTLINVVGTLAE